MSQLNTKFLDKFLDILQPPEVISELIRDDGTFPNNNRLPLLIYKNALKLPQEDAATLINEIFQVNKWGNSWLWGLYAFHHYHSTAHEALGIVSGEAEVQFGGEKGIVQSIIAGDIVIIPVGVAHMCLANSHDFLVVGAYPFGQSWDMMYGKPVERPAADENIKRVPLPESDPVYGANGPLIEKWIK